MESSEDLSITSFRIVFNNQLLEINYDPSFEEYKTVTIKSVIQKVLEKIGPQPLNTTSENYYQNPNVIIIVILMTRIILLKIKTKNFY